LHLGWFFCIIAHWALGKAVSRIPDVAEMRYVGGTRVSSAVECSRMVRDMVIGVWLRQNQKPCW